MFFPKQILASAHERVSMNKTNEKKNCRYPLLNSLIPFFFKTQYHVICKITYPHAVMYMAVKSAYNDKKCI